MKRSAPSAYISAMASTCTFAGQDDLSRPLVFAGGSYRNRILLAPMSGVTDVPFRRLAWQAGAGMVTSEMVASEAYCVGKEEMRLKAEGAGLPCHVVQIAGRDAGWMAEATRLAEGAGASVIDINMGCPARKVTSGWSGSALMRDLDHALRLIEATVGATALPVTLKMRLGWDEHSLNAPELAARAQDAGIRLVTVHARTRCQFYKGRADWTKVRAVRSATRLPLVVNGDIRTGADACNALRESGADAVMVGRAAYGAPWVCGAIAGTGTAPADLLEYVLAHHEAILAQHGVAYGLRMARKHLDWYLAALDAPVSAEHRQRMLRADSVAEARRAIRSCFATEPDALAA